MFAKFAIARAFLRRIPWQAWAALALLAVWWWDRDRHADQREAETRAEMQAQIDAAERARYAALAAEEEALRALAKRTDRNVLQARETHRDATERFIRSGGVRPQACPRSDAEDRSAGNRAPVHSPTVVDDAEPVQVVTVLPDDVRVCTDNTVLAEQFREFILGLEG